MGGFAESVANEDFEIRMRARGGDWLAAASAEKEHSLWLALEDQWQMGQKSILLRQSFRVYRAAVGSAQEPSPIGIIGDHRYPGRLVREREKRTESILQAPAEQRAGP